MESEGKRTFPLAALLLTAMATLAYGRSINHFYLSDDFLWLSLVKDKSIADYFLRELFSSNVFRPVFFAYLKINYLLFGFNPAGWNVPQIFVHLFNCLILGLLVRKVFKSTGLGVLSAVSFILHFANVEAVYWNSAASYTLTAAFSLLSIFFYLGFKGTNQKRFYFASLSTTILALSANEQAVCLPLLLAICEYRLSKLGTRGLKTLAPFVFVALLYVTVRFWVFYPHFPGGGYHFGVSLNFLKNLAFLFTASMAHFNFLELAEIWRHFQLEGNVAIFLGKLSNNPSLMLVAAFAPLFYLFSFLYVSQTRPFILFGVCAYLPVAFLGGTGERLLYLPLAGLAAVVPVCLHEMSKKLSKKQIFYFGLAVWFSYLFWTQQQVLGKWLTASRFTRQAVETIGKVALQSDKPITVCVDKIPHHYQGAWLFRMGFEKWGELFYPEGRVKTFQRANFECPDDSNRMLFFGGFKNYQLVLTTSIPNN